ncbi:MAG: SGNH/GDSL hydrolase family protein [Leptolyngbyaceae cyanobacterium]
MTLAFLGDSLFDTGNLNVLAGAFGIEPFPPPLYSGGKASNGLVLGEAIAAQLGIDPATIDLGFRLLPTFETNPLEQTVNYAVAGATTDEFGSASNDLEIVPIGLQSQAQLFSLDLIAAGAVVADAADRPDVLLSAGSNDVLEVLPDIAALADIMFSPDKTDDEALQQELAAQIAGNIEAAIASIDGLVDDIVIAGIPPLGDIPLARQIDEQVDDLLAGDFAGDTREFLTNTAAAINAQLSLLYDGPSSNPEAAVDQFSQFLDEPARQFLCGLLSDLSDDLLNHSGAIAENSWIGNFLNSLQDALLGTDCAPDPVDNVLVIDAVDIFEAGLQNWQNSLPEALEPIAELSYRDYLDQLGSGSPSELPGDLVVDQFAFVDGVHSTEGLNIELAKLVAAQITMEFPDFGVG